jgi:hypothetical protein
MDMRKPHVSYYIRKANENGYIKEVCRDRVKIFELTQRSKNFIDQYDKRIQNKQLASCRAENIRFKAPVHRLPAKTPDWHKVDEQLEPVQ